MSEVLDRPITSDEIFQFPKVLLHIEGKLLFFYYFHDPEYTSAIVVNEIDEVPIEVREDGKARPRIELVKVWVLTEKESIEKGSHMRIISKLENGEYLVAEVYPNKGATNSSSKSGGKKPPKTRRRKRGS